MDKITLAAPAPAHEAAFAGYREEHHALGDNFLQGSGGTWSLAASYADWLALLDATAHEETVRPGWVPANTYFAIREADGHIVGMVGIRHRLNEDLLSFGGHIGYGVRPSERRKGYATQMLRAALDICRGMGIPRALLTCDETNEASRRAIQACGGVLENSLPGPDGKGVVQRFWITL